MTPITIQIISGGNGKPGPLEVDFNDAQLAGFARMFRYSSMLCLFLLTSHAYNSESGMGQIIEHIDDMLEETHSMS